MNADALIFDMDGTLWDSSETVAKSWSKVMSDYPDVRDTITAGQLKKLMGMPLLDIGDKLFPYIEKEKRDKIMRDCCNYEDEVLRKVGGVLFEGLENTLHELKPHMKLFIVSNCQKGYIEAFFAYHKLQKYFDDHECAGATGKSKGENIIDIIERNKINLAYYVGDTQIDYEATRKARIPFIYASYGFGDVHHYEYKINAITDLVKMFSD